MSRPTSAHECYGGIFKDADARAIRCVRTNARVVLAFTDAQEREVRVRLTKARVRELHRLLSEELERTP